MKISPHAAVDRKAQIADDVEIGPFCVVGPDVQLAAGCRLINSVSILGHTRLGRNNVVFPNAVIGAPPQDRKYNGGPTHLEIGENNVIREAATIHCGTEKGGGITRVGDNNLIMVNVHVGHDAQIGSHTTLSNNVMIAGHVIVGDHVTMAGAVGLHHFVTVGEYAFLAGASRIHFDVPPFMIVNNVDEVRGVNLVGLKRAGFAPEDLGVCWRHSRCCSCTARPFRWRWARWNRSMGTTSACGGCWTSSAGATRAFTGATWRACGYAARDEMKGLMMWKDSDGPLRVGVVGCGRMGKLHARVYSQMSGVKLVGTYDVNPDAAQSAARDYHCQAFASLGELLPHVSAISVAVPTQWHAEIAEAALGGQVACLVEKPLARDAADGQRIIDAARRSGAMVQVGHIERFNPAVRAMERLNIAARFIEVTRISPLTFRSIDVGVVLDMMIHDIDIVLNLARSKIARIDAVGVSVIGDVEDICNARLTFENGCVANLTASRLALKTERKLRVFSRDAYVSIDYQRQLGSVVHRSGNLAAIRDAVARLRSGEIEDISQVNYMDLVKVEELQIDDVEPLRAELESFVAAVKDGGTPVVSAEEGLAAVETARGIMAAMTPSETLEG